MPLIDLELSRAESSGRHGAALQTQAQVPDCRASRGFLRLTFGSAHLPSKIHEDLQEWLPNLAAH